MMLSLKVDNEPYDEIPYIKHAENVLKNYNKIHDALCTIKMFIEEYSKVPGV
jgi:hypothetical protein